MISVLLLVFLLQLTIHLINTAGQQTINDVVRSHNTPRHPYSPADTL